MCSPTRHGHSPIGKVSRRAEGATSRENLTNWECITQDQWILDAVQGFKIPFTSTPRQAYPPAHIADLDWDHLPALASLCSTKFTVISLTITLLYWIWVVQDKS